MVNIPGLDNINFMGGFASIAKYVFYLLMILLMGGIAAIVMFFSQYTIKADVTPMYGSSNKGLSFGKTKMNRFKWVNNRTEWKPMLPLFSKKTFEPFESKYIYQNNKVICFKLGDALIPGELNLDTDSEETIINITPVPYYIRNWQSLAHKKNAQEFAKNDFWDTNKHFILGVITVAICCACALGTIYMAYKFAAPTTQALSGLSESIRNFNVIPGK
jgi:hypothetical protein